MFVWEVLKTHSPRIGAVLHWRPPDVHIFHIDPFLILIVAFDKEVLFS